MAEKIVQPIEHNYLSPRWTGEILDCGMPMTFDQYDHCSFNCLYCFSTFQKSLKVHNPLMPNQTKGYQLNPIRAVSPKRVRAMFNLETETQFSALIRKRVTLQWGGLSDPFDSNERRHGIGLECMEIFHQLHYPLRFSTKSTWWIDDPRYAAFVKDQKNWNLMVSIINLDEALSKKVERGVDSPAKRFEVLEKWVELGAGDAILRLRPFMIGMTDKNDEYLQMIEYAASIGCKGVSTEFFCLENRGDSTVVKKYDGMSEALGIDLVDFYRANSPGQTGYLRLNWALKKPYVDKMDALCKKLGMRLSVSDAHHKERGGSGACCSLGTNMTYNKSQFTEVLVKARKAFEAGKEATVFFSRDLEPGLKELGFDKFLWRRAEGMNTIGTKARTERYNMTMLEYFREIWNTPNSGKSPYKYFQGLLVPIGLDDKKDVIYEYRPYGDNIPGEIDQPNDEGAD